MKSASWYERGLWTPPLAVFGVLLLVGIGSVAWMSFVVSGPDTQLGETVRLMYVHVPSAITTYCAATIAWVGSIVWLKRRSVWWDMLSQSAGEVAAVYAALTLVTGMLWGKPTWGTYWVWDARLTTMLMLFLLLLGHRTLRESSDDPEVGARRSALVGLFLLPNIFVVNRSVEWWRGLHQNTTVQTIDPNIEGWQLTTLTTSVWVMFGVCGFLIAARFRLAWLERESQGARLELALEQRRAEASTS